MPLRRRTPYRRLTKTPSKDYTSEPLPLVGMDTTSGDLWVEGYVKSIPEAQQLVQDKHQAHIKFFIMENDTVLYEIE